MNPRKIPSRNALDVLIQDREPGKELEGARELPLNLIDVNPKQSRQAFNETTLAELAENIAQHGVLEPIIVRPEGGRYIVVAGERRRRAAEIAGLESIPAIIREGLTESQAAEITALENLQREDLDIEDEGNNYQFLMGLWGITSQRELARRLKINHKRVNRALTLLPYPAIIQQIRTEQITLREGLRAVGMVNVGTDNEEFSQQALIERQELDLIQAGMYQQDKDKREQEQRTSNPTGAGLSHGGTTPVRSSSPSNFSWRPYQQFSAVLDRTKAEQVAPDETESVVRQLELLEEKIVKLKEELRQRTQ